MFWEVSITTVLSIGIYFIYKPLSNLFLTNKNPLEISTFVCPFVKDSYGPETINWKLGIDASLLVSTSGAGILQMLHPDVVRLIEKNGKFYKKPLERMENTGLYGSSVLYGDKETVDIASTKFRKLHDSLAGKNSRGETYKASDPKLMLWVHNSLSWMILRGYRTYGPKLTLCEEDRYIVEQNISGRLIGIPEIMLPKKVSDVEKFLKEIETELCLNKNSLHYKNFFLYDKPSPSKISSFLEYFILYSGLYLMSDFHQELYGVKPNKIKKSLTISITKIIVNIIRLFYPPSKTIPQTVENLKTKSFGKF